MEYQEKAYSTKEVSLTLDIGDSTLRKWCLALEKNGYKFIRNDREQRLFIESDLVKLRHFQTLVKNHNMQLDNASMVVIDRFGKGAFEERTGSVPAVVEEEKNDLQRDLIRSNEEMKETLMQHIRTQEEFNQQLLQQLKEQQDYIEKSIERRDKLLMESIRGTLEERKEERKALLEIAAANEEKQKKGFFARLFGK